MKQEHLEELRETMKRDIEDYDLAAIARQDVPKLLKHIEELEESKTILKAGFETAIKCGDTQRRKIAELTEDLNESEHACEAWHKNVIELTPFELPSRHHAVELLHEWRKRWDELERKLVEGVDGTMPRPEVPTFQGLEQSLADWTDFDCASFELGVVMGLWPSDYKTWQENKHVFWTNNNLGNSLHKMLEDLAQNGHLERRDEPDQQYRWKKEGA